MINVIYVSVYQFSQTLLVDRHGIKKVI